MCAATPTKFTNVPASFNCSPPDTCAHSSRTGTRDEQHGHASEASTRNAGVAYDDGNLECEFDSGESVVRADARDNFLQCHRVKRIGVSRQVTAYLLLQRQQICMHIIIERATAFTGACCGAQVGEARRRRGEG